ncbi:hypothetical protein Btru_006193 [Bulinus truncatus]|nr:hypothetical protein Btru_006193 [Bulinus truncatus]
MTDKPIRRPTAKFSNKSWDRFVTVSLPSKLDHKKLINFTIHVYDTGTNESNNNQHVVVGIHGMPGTGQDFTSLANNLHSKGIRFIAPTSIGMEKSPINLKLLKEIDFSTTGHTKALQNTLNALGVHRIDLLVAHSAGAWTLYEVGANWNNVNSLVAVNPGGASPNRSIRPFQAMKLFAYILNNPIGRMIFKPIVVLGYKLQGMRDVNYGDHLIAAQNYIVNQQFDNVPKNAATIREKAVPFVLMYANNDQLIESSISSTMAYEKLGIPLENTVKFCKESKPDRDPLFVPAGWLCRVLVFARGGHVVHLAHEDEMVQQIQDLLKHIASRGKTFIRL